MNCTLLTDDPIAFTLPVFVVSAGCIHVQLESDVKLNTFIHYESLELINRLFVVGVSGGVKYACVCKETFDLYPSYNNLFSKNGDGRDVSEGFNEYINKALCIPSTSKTVSNAGYVLASAFKTENTIINADLNAIAIPKTKKLFLKTKALILTKSYLFYSYIKQPPP